MNTSELVVSLTSTKGLVRKVDIRRFPYFGLRPEVLLAFCYSSDPALVFAIMATFCILIESLYSVCWPLLHELLKIILRHIQAMIIDRPHTLYIMRRLTSIKNLFYLNERLNYNLLVPRKPRHSDRCGSAMSSAAYTRRRDWLRMKYHAIPPPELDHP